MQQQQHLSNVPYNLVSLYYPDLTLCHDKQLVTVAQTHTGATLLSDFENLIVQPSVNGHVG